MAGDLPGYDNLPYHEWVDPTPPPENIKDVPNVGATSAVLTSAAYAIGAHCKEYNEDFMLCKNENNDPAHCLKEGAKVTRCSIDLLTKLRANCREQLTKHWKCLELNNHRLFYCREEEEPLRACIFEKLGYKKEIPGAPKDEIPVHERTKRYYGHAKYTF
ncbi:ndufa8, NADH-ubiquinone oxidoreductase complex I 19kd subunit [Dimargaris xerosporica]|nr:ndufa8, NADH-ubiquinone oxidoreductase complex I 19kd subunit [Dimargaris xerosporica]